MRQELLHNLPTDLKRFAGYLFYRIAPVLLGLKPACLVYFYKDYGWVQFKERFDPGLGMGFPLLFFEFCQTPNGRLVMFYHEIMVKALLHEAETKSFLNSLGYATRGGVKQYLRQVRARFSKGFPHEIGIFLGIPVPDVVGFIMHRGKKYLLNGEWKVYCHPERAREIFVSYRKARQAVLEFLVRPERRKSWWRYIRSENGETSSKTKVKER